MSAEKFKTATIPYRQPPNMVVRLFRILKTGDLAVDHPDETLIANLIADTEQEGFALHRRRDDSLNRTTILSFVPLHAVLEDRLQHAEIPFRRKITPRTLVVQFYSILFMFLPWDLDDWEMVPDDRKIDGLILHRAERGYDLSRREDDPLNMKTVLSFEKRLP
jgi:hypothetical protein